jgi:hypothetical protein
VCVDKRRNLLPAATQKLGSGIPGMEITVIARQAFLFGHIIAFALALATIIKEDVRLLRAKRIDAASLHAAAKLVKWLLLALWVTGVPMVIMDVGTNVSLFLAKPKLVAKLIVVGTLTLNGLMLHLVAFPLITGKARNPSNAATIAATLGAVSTTSWFYASFVAVSRIVAPYFSVYDFVLLYVLALAVAVSFAILAVRSRFELALRSSSDLAVRQRRRLYALLREVENATLDLGVTSGRLQTRSLAHQFVRQASPPVSSVSRPVGSVGNSEMASPNRKPELPRVVRQHR